MKTKDKLEKEGEKYMQELWMELGYRVAEEPETYRALAEYINKKIKGSRNSAIDDALKLMKWEIECQEHKEWKACMEYIKLHLAKLKDKQ